MHGEERNKSVSNTATRMGSHSRNHRLGNDQFEGTSMSTSTLVTLPNDGHLGRWRRIPNEPKKFERQNLFLPLRDKVVLTSFVTLEEFYVRTSRRDSSYKRMLEELRIDYHDALENCKCQTWLKGDGAAVWFNRTWQRCVVSSPVRDSICFVDVFLIDVGATVTVTKDQLVPLCDDYHRIAPFAICCSIGRFDIFSGKRFELAHMCKQVTERLMHADMLWLDLEILDKIWDTQDKFKVRLTYSGSRQVVIPDCFVQENLITLK